MRSSPPATTCGRRTWSRSFQDAAELADLASRELRGAESLRRVVRVLAKMGADVVKVHTTERAGVPATDPRKPAFSEEEMRVVVEEAARFGIPVMAQAHGDEGAGATVRAGVRSIEHGPYLSRATMELMARRGTFLVSTLTGARWAALGRGSEPHRTPTGGGRRYIGESRVGSRT